MRMNITVMEANCLYFIRCVEPLNANFTVDTIDDNTEPKITFKMCATTMITEY